jgi:hypothetical protein
MDFERDYSVVCTTSGGAHPPCIAGGVQTNAVVPAASSGPPAAIEYALEPNAVATTIPSPAKRTYSSPSTHTSRTSWVPLPRPRTRSLIAEARRAWAAPMASAGRRRRAPIARREPVEPCAQLAARHRRERPEAAVRNTKHRRPGSGGCVQSLENRPVSPERCDQIGRAYLSRRRHPWLLTGRNLHQLQATLGRPALQDRHGILHRSGRVDENAYVLHAGCRLRIQSERPTRDATCARHTALRWLRRRDLQGIAKAQAAQRQPTPAPANAQPALAADIRCPAGGRDTLLPRVDAPGK